MKIVIDGIHYNVSAGKNLLDSCIGLGLDLPYFCYHPALGSVGACRQCAVRKFAGIDDKKGKIIMACMEPVTEGMIISIKDKEVRDFRAGVIEGLMINHPHDCPVCDEGGECHLQDMTVMTGHNYRRYAFAKRTYTNQYLGPFIHHEMNRCIQCYRCVRFYRDYAGGKDLNVFGAAGKLYFGRKEDGILESEFSGNLVEVCPTGVFTDKTLKQHYTRKWDLTNSPSVCTHCSVGCNILAGERYGMVRRVLNRYHGNINGYFLCDRGRYGYEFIHHPSRVKSIISRDPEITYSGFESLRFLFPGPAGLKKQALIVGIGSPRASLESNFALQQLVGKDRFFNGISAGEHHFTERATRLLKNANVKSVSLKEIEKCDAAILLNEDITHTAPVMALSVRQMTRNKAFKLAEKAGIYAWNDAATRELAQHEKSPLYIAHPYRTKLDDVASGTYYNSPPEIARLGFAVAAAIDEAAPHVPEMSGELKELAARIAADLLQAENPLLVSGIIAANDGIFDAITNLIIALASRNKKLSLAFAFPDSNSVGLSAMNGGNLDEAIEMLKPEPADILIILENDLYRRISKQKADALLQNSRKVIVIDHMMHSTGKKANIFLPASTWAESAGTIVNHQGFAQRYYPVLPDSEPVIDSWKWIIELMNISGSNSYSWSRFDDVVSSMSQYFAAFHAISRFPDSSFRIQNEKVAMQTMRFSGRTAITAHVTVNEPKPPEDADSPLKFSMEGFRGRPPASLVPFYWWPGWNSQQAINKYLDQPNGSHKDGDPGVNILTKEMAASPEYSVTIPEAFKPLPDKFLLIPVPRIFGSEELSARGEAISQLIPSPFLLLNEKDSEKLKIKTTDTIMLAVNETNLTVSVQTDNALPEGVAGLSLLFPGMEYIDFPAAGSVIKT